MSPQVCCVILFLAISVLSCEYVAGKRSISWYLSQALESQRVWRWLLVFRGACASASWCVAFGCSAAFRGCAGACASSCSAPSISASSASLASSISSPSSGSRTMTGGCIGGHGMCRHGGIRRLSISRSSQTTCGCVALSGSGLPGVFGWKPELYKRFLRILGRSAGCIWVSGCQRIVVCHTREFSLHVWCLLYFQVFVFWSPSV